MDFWVISGILFWVVLMIIGILIFSFRKNILPKIGIKLFAIQNLIDAGKKMVREIKQGDLKEETVAEVGAHILYRFTRIGILMIIVTFLPLVFLGIQTLLINNQNKLFKIQNDRIGLQNNLLEAERRSSLVFLMSNILDKVDSEIRLQQSEINTKNLSSYSLSQPLIGRIVALSRAFRSYKVLQLDSLSTKPVSPERGQLFIALMESNLDNFTQGLIFTNGDFSDAVIGKANLIRVNFGNGANLSGADLSYADFSYAKLTTANLSNTNLSNAIMLSTNLQGAVVNQANFYNADLSWVDFSKTKGLTKKQLIVARSLHECKNLPDSIESFLHRERPCLFELEGCK